MSVELDKVVPFGRSRREYELMFRLSRADLSGRILGCGDGPASFNAEMARDGHHVVSIDPIYAYSGNEIRRRFDETIDDIMAQVKATPDNWTWSYHRDVDDLRRNRCDAMNRFLADYDRGREEGRYLEASLPSLPFSDATFDIALCSHLLFLYSKLLDADFHVDSSLELCRVAKEVRVFPLLKLDRKLSQHLKAVRTAASTAGIQSRIEKVEYELQKGGNEMLVLSRD